MYVHAGDIVRVRVNASASIVMAFGSDLQARLQAANLRVTEINHNAVPVSSGWSFGPLWVSVIPQVDYSEVAHVAGIVENAVAEAGYYVEWGQATGTIAATAASAPQYQILQTAPPIVSPEGPHAPGLLEAVGLDPNRDGVPDLPQFTTSPVFIAGAVAVLAVVVLMLRR